MFDTFPHDLASGAPVKYELNWKDLTDAFTNQVSLTFPVISTIFPLQLFLFHKGRNFLSRTDKKRSCGIRSRKDTAHNAHELRCIKSRSHTSDCILLLRSNIQNKWDYLNIFTQFVWRGYSRNHIRGTHRIIFHTKCTWFCCVVLCCGYIVRF